LLQHPNTAALGQSGESWARQHGHVQSHEPGAAWVASSVMIASTKQKKTLRLAQ
jgi:threonine aldolase